MALIRYAAMPVIIVTTCQRQPYREQQQRPDPRARTVDNIEDIHHDDMTALVALVMMVYRSWSSGHGGSNIS